MSSVALKDAERRVALKSEPELEVRPSGGGRLIGIEGLRGIAALTVLVGHVEIHLANGVVFGHRVMVLQSLLLNGLTLFFALSGFLLFRPFARSLLTGGTKPSVRKYFGNRALRVYPAYVAILLFVAVVVGVAYTRAAGTDSGVGGVDSTLGRLSPGLLLTDLTMFQTLFPGSIKTGLGVSWSLTVELVFYITLPLMTWVLWRLGGRLRAVRSRVALALIPAALLLVLGLAGRVLVHETTPRSTNASRTFYYEWGSNWHAVLALSFVSQADLFAFGMMAAVAIAVVDQGILRGAWIQVARAVAGGGVVVGILGGRHFDLTSDTWWALGCGSLIFLVAAPGARPGSHSLLARALELLPFRYVGLVSYSIYLWHEPVLWFLQQHGLTAGASHRGLVQNVVVVFGVTLALSSITYFGIERPALRFKQSTKLRAERRSSAAVNATV